MSDIISFDFEQKPVQVIEQDGEPWFVAPDVCRVLELADVTDAGPGNPIFEEYERTLHIISTAKPVTLEGLAARARAALAEAESEAPPEGPD